MKRNRTEQIAFIRDLVNQLAKEFESIENSEYRIIIESYDENDDYLFGEEVSNNWERSWC